MKCGWSSYELAGKGTCHCSLTRVLCKDVLFLFQPNNYLAFIDHTTMADCFLNIGQIAPSSSHILKEGGETNTCKKW